MPAKPIPMRKDGQVGMRTLRDSQLAVTIFPGFGYDARGGGGVAEAVKQESGRLQLTFDPQTLSIPDVSFQTATFLGLPLPPLFRIAVDSKSLTGWVDRLSGEVMLDFVAEFHFTFSIFGWTLYAAPPLYVITRLTTGTVKGRQLGGKGSPINANGCARLVGVADVQKSGDRMFDSFLRLPGNTMAVMSSQFEF